MKKPGREDIDESKEEGARVEEVGKKRRIWEFTTREYGGKKKRLTETRLIITLSLGADKKLPKEHLFGQKLPSIRAVVAQLTIGWRTRTREKKMKYYPLKVILGELSFIIWWLEKARMPLGLQPLPRSDAQHELVTFGRILNWKWGGNLSRPNFGLELQLKPL